MSSSMFPPPAVFFLCSTGPLFSFFPTHGGRKYISLRALFLIGRGLIHLLLLSGGAPSTLSCFSQRRSLPFTAVSPMGAFSRGLSLPHGPLQPLSKPGLFPPTGGPLLTLLSRASPPGGPLPLNPAYHTAGPSQTFQAGSTTTGGPSQNLSSRGLTGPRRTPSNTGLNPGHEGTVQDPVLSDHGRDRPRTRGLNRAQPGGEPFPRNRSKTRALSDPPEGNRPRTRA